MLACALADTGPLAPARVTDTVLDAGAQRANEVSMA
jgi:hypothetical protein